MFHAIAWIRPRHDVYSVLGCALLAMALSACGKENTDRSSSASLRFLDSGVGDDGYIPPPPPPTTTTGGGAEDGYIPPPPTDGGTTGGSTPPATDPGTTEPGTPPTTDGGTTGSGAGTTTPPIGDGGTIPEPGAGTTTPPIGDGGTIPEPGAGATTPPIGDGGTIPNLGGGTTLPGDGGTIPGAGSEGEHLIACSGGPESFKLKLNTISGNGANQSGKSFAFAHHPILSIEARIPSDDLTKNPRSSYKHNDSAKGPQAYEMVQEQETILLKTISLSENNLFGPKFSNPVSLDSEAIDWDASNSSLARGWEKVLVAFYVCDDSNGDGKCSDEALSEQIAPNPPVHEVCKLPSAIVVGVRF